jgi:hypothetical protein
MKESYMEGVANRCGPESCAVVRKDRGEALTGESTGRVQSRDKSISRVPTPFHKAEGNMHGCVIASPQQPGAVVDLLHVRTLHTRESGGPIASQGRWTLGTHRQPTGVHR